MTKKVYMFVFGTRPEAIKMCPVIKEAEKNNSIKTLVCVTGQHKEMLNQVLSVFKIKPDYNLSIMKNRQTLFDITITILNKIQDVLLNEKPDVVLVHGDTSTAFVTSLACYYLKIKVAHIEAGLRTYNIYSPFPEEFNRQCISIISEFDFAPTEEAKMNLLKLGKKSENIYVTGNTAIDALKTTVKKNYSHPILDWLENDKLILLTAHRRENIGEPLINIFNAIKRIADEESNVKIVYPVHLNPKVKTLANKILANHDRIRLIDPLDVLEFHNLLARSYLVLTDSGGIQEEAPALNKPVLVLRKETERPEGVLAGTLKITGTDEEKIYYDIKNLLHNKKIYRKMSQAINPYGDGFASERIIKRLEKKL